MQNYTSILRPLLLLLFAVITCIVLYYGSTFLIPITYGAMFAFLVNPMDQKLLSLGLNKYFAAILSVLTILVFVFVLLSVFGWQIQQLTEQGDKIKKELVETQETIQDFARNQFGISVSKQEKYSDRLADKLKDKAGSFIGTSASVLTHFFLALIYAILLLSEKKRIQAFIYKILKDKSNANDAIKEVAKVTQKYLGGKLIIIAILATVYAVGFLLVGIQYAVLIAVLAAFLSFIPYIGNIIGGSIAALITLATGGSITDILILFSIIAVAQVVESYVLSPWIVGKNVNLNPLFSILAVIGLSAIWGAAGAIIALPLVGMFKVIFDHFDAYQPIGFLMGDETVEE